MSTQSEHTHLPLPAGGAEAAGAPARSAWSRALAGFREKLQRRRQLRALVELDERLLADVGITREQALRAARSASWI